MKKLLPPVILLAGLLFVLSGKVHQQVQTAICKGQKPEKDILLPAAALMKVLAE
jgi:hypothetical protein